MKREFECLYGEDKKGDVKEWYIYVEEKGEYSEIVYSYGKVNCKKQTRILKIEEGKNIGKKNETTHYEQAVKEAESRWLKKMEREGYKIKESKTQIEKQSVKKWKPMMPMLAQTYMKYENKIQFPCYVQPKLDGYRMIYSSEYKKMSSRTGKEFEILYQSELFKELEKIKENVVLDGEMYIHNGKFENLGVLRKKNVNKKEMEKLNKIEYHVYDIIDSRKNYGERCEMLKEIIGNGKIRGVVLVSTELCKNKTDIIENSRKFIMAGYEGSIIRNDTAYEIGKRSFNLQKYKEFTDSEFEITGFECEKVTNGKDPCVVWECKTDSGLLFKVRPQGSEEERAMLFTRANKFLGKKLWVKYQELTEDGIPRFPTTMRNSYIDYIRETII